jgi:tetratricopeptide (TPR) repeat protein
VIRRLSVAAVLCGAAVALTLPASGEDALTSVRARIAAGDRTAARAALDSMLAAADTLTADARTQAYYLRTLLEENGAAFADRLRSLLREDPESDRRAWIDLSLGKIAFAEGDLAEALTRFRDAADNGLREEGRLWEGLTDYALGDGAGARKALEGVRTSGNRAVRERALVVTGDTFRAAKAWDAAAAAYRKVREEEEPGLGWWAAAAYREAECLEQMGREAEAVNVLRELAARAPRSYESALAQARLRELDLAVAGASGEEPPEGTTPASEPYRRFTVQVGAFGSEDNAKGLAQRVEQAGFSPVRVVLGYDNLYRVFVGRIENRPGAESLGDSLGASLGLGFSVVEEP